MPERSLYLQVGEVHGMLTSLLPMKSSMAGMTKYFDGQLTNSKKPMHIVGFTIGWHNFMRVRVLLHLLAPK